MVTSDQSGQHSIRINDQWRICFVWKDGAGDVGIVDGHRWRHEDHPGSDAPGLGAARVSMAPLGLSANALALVLRVPATRIGAIIRQERPRAVTADTALRLAGHFGPHPNSGSTSRPRTTCA